MDFFVKESFERTRTPLLLPRRASFTPSAKLSTLVCRYSNLVLTDSERRIEACARQVSRKMSSKRSLQTGQVYGLPPEQAGHIPSESETFLEWKQKVKGSAAEGQSPLGLASAMSKSYRVCHCQRSQATTLRSLPPAWHICDDQQPGCLAISFSWRYVQCGSGESLFHCTCLYAFDLLPCARLYSAN